MRKALAMVLVCLGLVVAAPQPAHAMLGIDFMEWLNDMSGPGPFHVFGVEATVACWGKIVKLDKRRVEEISPELAAAVARIRALAAADKADAAVARESPGRLPPDDFRRLLDAQLALGLEIDRPIVFFKPDGDIATKDPVSGAFFGLSALKSMATGSLAFACNQPRSDDQSLVVDLHKPVVMAGLSFDYLFTPINHLPYEGQPPEYNTPNIHAILMLATADVEFKRFLSIGYGEGFLRFNGGSTYQSFQKHAIQVRFGLRPLKHLDHGARAPRPADQITHAGLADLPPGARQAVIDGTNPRSDPANPLLEDVPHQGALKKLSTLRFILGYTYVPGANLNAAKFGAIPGSWQGGAAEHIMTAHFTLDLSRARSWHENTVKVAGRASPQRIGERAIY